MLGGGAFTVVSFVIGLRLLALRTRPLPERLIGSSMLSCGWCFLECGHYDRLLQRRLRIGLADPVVTDRFALYAAATGMAVATNTIGQLYWWRGVEMLTDELGALLRVALGSGSCVLMCLAFISPRASLERVRAGSVARA